jgi:hypothetical protein
MQIIGLEGKIYGKQDIGWHSEATPPGLIRIVREGVVTGKYKSIDKGKVVVTSIGGAPKEDMEWVDAAVSRHLQKKFELGLFENPYVDEDRVLEVFDTPALTQYPYFADHSRESFDMALETAMKIGKNLMKPKLSEMDLDAILARRPQLALVDEHAHTNAPGSRHPKRWQDIEEILAAGIDVYTTLNIQHLESFRDLVAQISGVIQRETIPDRVLDGASEIEVVDLPPEELDDEHIL